MANKYPVDLDELYEIEIDSLTAVFTEIGTRGHYALNQEGEDSFRLKCREIADEVAKHVINNERKRHAI